MNDDTRAAEQAALDALKATILDPTSPAIVLAIDVPFKAVLLGLSWTRLCALFDEGTRRLSRLNA